MNKERNPNTITSLQLFFEYYYYYPVSLRAFRCFTKKNNNYNNIIFKLPYL